MIGHPIKQAFILGAGMGSRMRPLTDALPKPLVPLHGRPLIDHVIDRLKAVGVEKIIVNVHYLADQLEAHLQTHKDIKVIISDERDSLLDTGGGLIKARPFLDDAPFFIHNSDSVWLEEEGAEHSNLSRLSKAFDAEKMESLLLLANRHTSLGYDGKGDFLLNEDGTLKRRSDKDETDYVFAGVSIARPSFLNDAPSGAFSLNHLWNQAISNNKLYGLKHQGLWMHVGTPEALIEAEAKARGGLLI